MSSKQEPILTNLKGAMRDAGKISPSLTQPVCGSPDSERRTDPELSSRWMSAARRTTVLPSGELLFREQSQAEADSSRPELLKHPSHCPTEARCCQSCLRVELGEPGTHSECLPRKQRPASYMRGDLGGKQWLQGIHK